MATVRSVADLEGQPHATAFAEGPRVVRLRLDPGEGVPAHTHPESTVLLHVLQGEMEVALDDETHALAAGDLLRFDGRREVAPTAGPDERVTALVVFTPREGG
jgi:mannose-6-phosphate isomerase-like protein (cupin superfamily)